MSIKKSVVKTLTSSPIDIYEVPTNKKAQITFIYLKNESGSTSTAEIDYYDSSATTTFAIIDGYSLQAKETFELFGNDNKFLLIQAGDKITASATGSMTLILSLIEQNDIIQGG